MLTSEDLNELDRIRIAYLAGDISRIEAIKRVRNVTFDGIRESKEIVDAWANTDLRIMNIRKRVHAKIDEMSNAQVLEMARDLFVW